MFADDFAVSLTQRFATIDILIFVDYIPRQAGNMFGFAARFRQYSDDVEQCLTGLSNKVLALELTVFIPTNLSAYEYDLSASSNSVRITTRLSPVGRL